MRHSIANGQAALGELGKSGGRTMVIVLALIAALGLSTVSGSLLYQWKRSEAVRDAWVDTVAEQEAKATLKEAGFLVLTCPDTKHVYYVNSFGRTDIEDVTLERLAALRHLVTVDLSESNIDDEQLSYLSGLPKLVCLRLDGTRISHKGLACLADSLDLTMLYLHGASVSDEGMRHIARMRNLKLLSARSISGAEEGFKRLQPMNDIRWLVLAEINDAAVPYLMEMRNLKRLSVNHNKISEGKLKQLKKALPRLVIETVPAE
jgi:hypothetical protein